MTKTIKLLTTVTAIILMSSFASKNTIECIGTYGVSDADPAQIKLTVNADHTFYYQDFSISAKKIVISGNWILNGKKVVLNATNSENKFHNVWTFEKNGLVAKSRKGFTFYRLCKIAS